MGRPQLSTMFAAWGSARILNSADGERLPPSRIAPPMMTISLTFLRISGCRSIAVPILLNGPVGISVTFSVASRVSTMKSTACRSCKGVCGSKTSIPSMPVSPCIYSAVIASRTMGFSQPAKTGISGRPAISHIMRALRCVSSSGTFPATVVMPSIPTSSGDDIARNSATASSCPGSQSIMIGRGAMESERQHQSRKCSAHQV